VLGVPESADSDTINRVYKQVGYRIIIIIIIIITLIIITLDVVSFSAQRK